MSFELIYKEIGDIGRYQIYVLLLGWICGIYGGFIWINSIFLLYVPEHRYGVIIVHVHYLAITIEHTRHCYLFIYFFFYFFLFFFYFFFLLQTLLH